MRELSTIRAPVVTETLQLGILVRDLEERGGGANFGLVQRRNRARGGTVAAVDRGDERATTVAAFLRRALAFYAAHGICVERVITDNGSAYRSTVHTDIGEVIGLVADEQAVGCKQLPARVPAPEA